MANYDEGIALRKLIYGLKIDRETAALPETTTGGIFTIATGRVILTGLIGEVTTAIQNQACNLSVTSTPTTGSAVALCAVLNVQAAEEGCLFTISGTQATALFSVAAGAGGGYMPSLRWVLPIGSLGLLTSATNTGSVKWTAFYVPLDDGATLVSA